MTSLSNLTDFHLPNVYLHLANAKLLVAAKLLADGKHLVDTKHLASIKMLSDLAYLTIDEKLEILWSI